MSGHGVSGWSTEQQKSFQLGLCYWHPNYSAHLCAVLQDTRFWRKRAMKKSWWLTEVRQDGDTDHYQLLKATKRHIQNLCIVPRQEEPRRNSELVSLLSCGIATGAGPSTIWTEADGQHGHHCLGAPWLYGLQGSSCSRRSEHGDTLRVWTKGNVSLVWGPLCVRPPFPKEVWYWRMLHW